MKFERINWNFLFSTRNILIVSLILFILRIIISIFFIDFYNAVEDFRIAENIVAGNGFSLYSDGTPTALKAPLYPLILSLFVFIFATSSKLAVVIFQHLLFSLIPVLLVKFGEVCNRKDIGYLAGWLFLVNPSYFYYPNVIEVTNIFIFLSIILLITAQKAIINPHPRILLFLGILTGLILLIQPIVTPIIIAFWIYLIFKKGIWKFVLTSLTALIIVSPWIIRNYMEFDKFIPGKSPFWMNIYVGYLPENHLNDKFNLLEQEDIRTIDSLNNLHISDIEMETYYKEFTLKAINKSPVLYIEKFFYQASSYWWIPARYYDDNSVLFLVARKIPLIFLNILTLFGIFFMVKKDRDQALIIVLTLLYFTFVYGMTQNANIRFKLDIEWLQFIPASYLLQKIMKPLKI